jgi:DNA polymerase-3 subunit epsilon
VAEQGFAIIDFETTGFNAGGTDRIVEVAVVHADVDGRVTGAWDTLVNPGRDVGATRIHGITGGDVMRAPSFAQIAPRLVELLAGRVLVAHNASFDTRFLIAELTRAGYPIDPTAHSLCTMRLAREYLPGARRSLRDCCDAFDIEIGDAHRASADALATARLLAAYIASSGGSRYWSDVVDRAARFDWPPLAVLDADWVTREVSSAPQQTFLQRISERLPDESGPHEHSDYLALLDRCLLDRTISRHESDQLVELAAGLGIGRSLAEDLNRRYFGALVQVAWEDGVLTTEEREDVATVAVLLQIEPAVLEAAMTAPPTVGQRIEVSTHRPLEPGDLVVLTGDMRRSREEWEQELTALGYRPWRAVTKKVRLVVAADPDSISGKARKARDYDIPIVDEKTLERLLEAPASMALARAE